MQIIDVFIFLRETALDNTEIRLEIEVVKRKLQDQGKNIELIFQYLDELIEKKAPPRRQIGYKRSAESNAIGVVKLLPEETFDRSSWTTYE